MSDSKKELGSAFSSSTRDNAGFYGADDGVGFRTDFSEMTGGRTVYDSAVHRAARKTPKVPPKMTINHPGQWGSGGDENFEL